MRLALYAHYSVSAVVARHVLHHLRQLRQAGFNVCFISNSPVSAPCVTELEAVCGRIIQRENVGYDFSMWKAGLAEYDFSVVDELLLTNSSILGPFGALDELWKAPNLDQCDFWGLTDNCDCARHIQSFFFVFRRRVVQSDCFARFWASILDYTDKAQVIRSYEIGLTTWFEQNGFKWLTLFPQAKIWRAYLNSKENENLPPSRKQRLKQILTLGSGAENFPRFPHEDIWRKHLGVEALNPRAERYLRMRGLPGLDTTLYYPGILVQAGMPYLKAALFKPGNPYLSPRDAYAILKDHPMPQDALDELRPVDGDNKNLITATFPQK